jgi:DNA-binding NarL/FixJ family response regulator
VAVIRALQQGKPNKVIAYELNMCESTVKVHVRNLMKKMKAKNRTDLAIKTQAALQPQAAPALAAQRVPTVFSERW